MAPASSRHFGFGALHRPGAHTERRCDFVHPRVALPQGAPDGGFGRLVGPRPTKRLALGAGAAKAGVDALPNDSALELGEHAHHLETLPCRPALWCRAPADAA